MAALTPDSTVFPALTLFPGDQPVLSFDELSDFYIHSISVEQWLGTGAKGDIYAAPVSVTCFVDDTTKLIRSATGEQTVSGTTIYAPSSAVTVLTVQARVTIASGRVSRIINVNGLDGPFGLDHVEVNLL